MNGVGSSINSLKCPNQSLNSLEKNKNKHQEFLDPFFKKIYPPLTFAKKIEFPSISKAASSIKQAMTTCFNRAFGMHSSCRTFLPRDPDLIFKRLENGVTCYVRHNKNPFEKKACIKLVIRTGFLNEARFEKGMAHMIEHIAQEETTHFAEDEIHQYFDSIGMVWGGDNNAYTSSRETVYILNVPLDQPEALEKALFILSETASQATLSDATIEKERKVVIDELRLRSTIKQRYFAKLSSLALEGTPYPKLFDKEFEIKNVSSFTPEAIRKFYKRWYHPKNIAIIAVGDFDAKKITADIENFFGKIPSSKNPSITHTSYPTPHNEMRFFSFSDPESILTEIGIYRRLPYIEKEIHVNLPLEDLKRFITNKLFTKMLNERLSEIVELQDPSFMRPRASQQSFISLTPFFNFIAVAKEGEAAKAFKQLLIEKKRIQRFGFSETEFENAKKNFINGLEHYVEEKNIISSKSLADLYKCNFIDDISIPNPEEHLKAQIKLVPQVTLKEINKWASLILKDDNSIFSTIIPEKEGIEKITESDIKQVIAEVESEPVTPYVHKTLNQPLLPQDPNPGKIVSTSRHEKSDVVEYTLENGLRVFVKPTSYENDRIMIYGFSARGTRNAPLKDLASAKFSDLFYEKCGLGEFDLVDLKKTLSGKSVTFSTSLENYLTTIQTTAVKKDLETSFQLFHLMFINPGYSKNAFDKAMQEAKESLSNRLNNPFIALDDEVMATNTQNHPEFKRLTLEDLKTIDFETSKNFHQESFATPSNFNIFIVGNLDHQNVKGLVEKYMASLPKKDQTPLNFKYSPVPFPQGIVHKKVFAGSQLTCRSYVTFPARISDDYSERVLSECCCDLMQTRLFEVLRRRMGKTYAPLCSFDPSPIPNLFLDSPSQISINFTCDPDHLKEIEEALLNEIRQLQEDGISEVELKNYRTAKEQMIRKHFSTNKGWIETLASSLLWNRSPEQFGDFEACLQTLNLEMIKNQFKKLFPLDNYSFITLHPKEAKEQNSKVSQDQNSEIKNQNDVGA